MAGMDTVQEAPVDRYELQWTHQTLRVVDATGKNDDVYDAALAAAKVLELGLTHWDHVNWGDDDVAKQTQAATLARAQDPEALQAKLDRKGGLKKSDMVMIFSVWEGTGSDGQTYDRHGRAQSPIQLDDLATRFDALMGRYLIIKQAQPKIAFARMLEKLQAAA